MAPFMARMKQDLPTKRNTRNHLVASAAKSVSSGVVALAKALFLSCTGSIAQCVRHKRSRIRERCGTRVSQLRNDQEMKSDESQNNTSLQRETSSLPNQIRPTPVVAITMQFKTRAPVSSSEAKHLSEAPAVPEKSPKRPTLPRHSEYQSQTDLIPRRRSSILALHEAIDSTPPSLKLRFEDEVQPEITFERTTQEQQQIDQLDHASKETVTFAEPLPEFAPKVVGELTKKQDFLGHNPWKTEAESSRKKSISAQSTADSIATPMPGRWPTFANSQR